MKKMLLIFLTGIFLTGCGNNNNPDSIEASGNIESTNVIVSSKVNGEIEKILYDEGQFVNEGDTIDWIAFEEYGDSAMWRFIAETNNLDDPLRLKTGQVLVIAPQT